MTIPPCLAALQELQASSDPQVHLHGLRSIKNDIVGHPLRKQLVVRNGLLYVLRSVVSSSSYPSDVHFQAILVIGSLANGGKSFLDPLSGSGLLTVLFDSLAQPSSPRILTATLRTLVNWADSWCASYHDNPHAKHASFMEQTSRISHLETLVSILAKARPHDVEGRAQIGLTSRLVSTTCKDYATRSALVDSGMLTALATQLLDHAPGTDRKNPPSRTLDPATLAAVFDAISCIIIDSPYRTFQFIFESSTQALFSSSAPRNLPIIPLHQARLKSKSFPACMPRSQRVVEYPEYAIEAADPLRQWLVFTAREQAPTQLRLSALRLLARLNAVTNTPDAYTRKTSGLLLAVPLAVKLVRDMSLDAAEGPPTIVEQAPQVLADLVSGKPQLQQAAVDAGAIKFLCVLLKRTFKPIESARQMWNPQDDGNDSVTMQDEGRVMGGPGLPEELSHIMKLRTACLDALRATAAVRPNEVRLDASMVSCVAECLILGEQLTVDRDAVKRNTTPVAIAACYLLREVSKDTSQARTSVVDAKVADPILTLMRHPQLTVKTAATTVCCNLVAPICPLRKDLISAGVLQVLLEHVRSDEMGLRVRALIGLKHAAVQLPEELRLEILRGLGGDTIMGLIDDERVRSHLGQSLASINAAHESVNLLYTQGQGRGDDLVSEDDNQTDGKLDAEVLPHVYQSSGLRSTLEKEPQPRELLRLLMRWETNQHVRSMRDRDNLQAQMLFVLGNIIIVESAATNIDVPSSEAIVQAIDELIGLDRLLDIIRSKFEAPLMDWDVYTSLRRLKQDDLLPANAVSNEVVLAAMKLLCHLVASSEQLCQRVVEHKELVQSLITQLGHAEEQIKVQTTWTIINLLHHGAADLAAAKRRALELRLAGVEHKLIGLVNDDEPDLRYRARTAVNEFNKLLNDVRSE